MSRVDDLPDPTDEELEALDDWDWPDALDDLREEMYRRFQVTQRFIQLLALHVGADYETLQRQAGIDIEKREGVGCHGCEGTTLGELYMVHDDVWKAATGDDPFGWLCVGCLEDRLGRRLTPDDFNDAPCNDPNFLYGRGGWHSSRLLSRLNGTDEEDER